MHGMHGTWNESDIVSIQLQTGYGEGDWDGTMAI